MDFASTTTMLESYRTMQAPYYASWGLVRLFEIFNKRLCLDGSCDEGITTSYDSNEGEERSKDEPSMDHNEDELSIGETSTRVDGELGEDGAHIDMPVVHDKPLTRSRAKSLRTRINAYVAQVLLNNRPEFNNEEGDISSNFPKAKSLFVINEAQGTPSSGFVNNSNNTSNDLPYLDRRSNLP